MQEDLGGCQNYGPFLGTLDIRGRIIIGTQKGTTVLTTTHLGLSHNYGYLFGAPIIGIIVFWGLYWGSLILGNYHLGDYFPFPSYQPP